MKLALDPPVRCRRVTVAALCQTRVESRGWPQAAVFTCEKSPVAILAWLDGEVVAWRPNGEVLDAAVLDSLCPGVAEAFRSAAA
ncbi:MAG: hypothetical protein QNJ44_00980 [Rhodobacter sp.]|nr:hypothetical protein [Rhodobacter sp.]